MSVDSQVWVELPLTADVSQHCSVVSSQLCPSADLALPGCASVAGLLMPLPTSVVTSAGSLRAAELHLVLLFCFLAAPRLPP